MRVVFLIINIGQRFFNGRGLGFVFCNIQKNCTLFKLCFVVDCGLSNDGL